jgi:general secretion pathway protein I
MKESKSLFDPPLFRPQKACGGLSFSFANGFTLIEVLIALVILAVALAAAGRSASMTADSATVMKQRLLGQWVADNQLSRDRTAARSSAWPEIGTRSGNEDQAGQSFTWQETVSATANPFFRRVEIKVFPAQDQSHSVAQLIGYLSNPK